MNIDFYSLELIKYSSTFKFNHNSYSLIGVYFSAHWCPPSRLFTPKLISLYNLINSSKSNLEIISVSFDRDFSCWESYFEEMPWLAIPFSNEKQRRDLAQEFKVVNPFKLLIFTSAGKLVTFQGIDDLRSKGSEAFEYWMSGSSSMSRFATPPFCPSGHLMVYVSASNNETCQNCNTQIVLGWECTDCKHQICESCQEWLCNSTLEESEAKCLKLHTLRKSSRLNEFYLKRFLYDKYNCRTCNELQTGEGLHCRTCLFDLCFSCVAVISQWSSMKKPKCDKNHELVWKSDLCMVIQEKFKHCQFRCEECGESYIGGGAFGCIDCEYYLCVKCFSLFNKSV